MLILHGEEDTTVLPEESIKFYKKYKQIGNKVELKLLKGCKHAFILFHYTSTEEQVFSAILEIDDYLVRNGFIEE